MIHRPWLLILLLASCAPPPSPRTAPAVSAMPEAGTCRAGPDGAMLAERGIGGTGAAPGPAVTAERGIGGTGIVGVITGFASVCLAGQEVQYPPDLPVLVDGQPATLASLRVGQVAVVQAAGARPVATSLALRHEVSGPLDRIEPDGALRVAGQRVLPPPGTPTPAEGAWLRVSGFRREDATIAATRFDPRAPGEVLIRGAMVVQAGRLRIGITEIRPGPGQFRQPGIPAVAIGRLRDGVLLADTVEPDVLLSDPVRYFGPRIGVLIVEGYAERGVLRFGPGYRFRAPFAEGRALARLERAPGGAFTPAFVREYGATPAPRPNFGPNFSPAPMPNRIFDRGPGANRPDGAGPPGRSGRPDHLRGPAPSPIGRGPG